MQGLVSGEKGVISLTPKQPRAVTIQVTPADWKKAEKEGRFRSDTCPITQAARRRFPDAERIVTGPDYVTMDRDGVRTSWSLDWVGVKVVEAFDNHDPPPNDTVRVRLKLIETRPWPGREGN